jgi:hypothetical protein
VTRSGCVPGAYSVRNHQTPRNCASCNAGRHLDVVSWDCTIDAVARSSRVDSGA